MSPGASCLPSRPLGRRSEKSPGVPQKAGVPIPLGSRSDAEHLRVRNNKDPLRRVSRPTPLCGVFFSWSLLPPFTSLEVTKREERERGSLSFYGQRQLMSGWTESLPAPSSSSTGELSILRALFVYLLWLDDILPPPHT